MQFKFWSPQLHQHLCLHVHSTQLNNSRFALTPISTLLHPVLVTGFMQYLQTSSTLCTCYPLYQYIFCVPASDNKYTVLNYQWLYHRHHMAILQPSALPSAIPHNLGFIHIYSHASLHKILPLIKPFNYIFSLSHQNQ